MPVPSLVTGNDIMLPVQLRKNGLTFIISTAALVKARLVLSDNTKAISAVVDQSSETFGSAWGTSLVVISFPNLTLTSKFQGNCLIEISIADPWKLSWFVPVTVRTGNI